MIYIIIQSASAALVLTHYDSYVGFCKLENEMLKEAKNAENHIFRQKMSFVSVFQNFTFHLEQPY